MSEIILGQRSSAPPIPASGKVNLYVDNTSPRPIPHLILPNGTLWTSQDSRSQVHNCNTADVSANASETYLTGSSLQIPSGVNIKVGTLFWWRFRATKTAASTAAGSFRIKVGVNGTTADTTVSTFTMAAQTAATDTMTGEIVAVVRSIGASTALKAVFYAMHPSASGFWGTGLPQMPADSTGLAFDSTVANLIFGISATPNTAGVWTFQLVEGEALNII